MQKIASFPSSTEAEQFRWYLHSQSIPCLHDTSDHDDKDVWVLSDDDLARARSLHAEFVQAAVHLPLADLVREGRKSLTNQAKAERKAQAARQPRSSMLGETPLTLTLLIISSLIFLLGYLGQMQGSRAALVFVVKHLRFSLYQGHSFYEISQGELWRLITPMFLHEGFLHIIFNMMWLWILGRQAEVTLGRPRYLALILAIAVCSHVVFYLVAGPNFGGMSGVNYGLAAYLWGLEQWGSFRNPDASQGQFFLVWYVVCLVLTLFGIPVANTIHAVGAIVGFLAALVSARGLRGLLQLLRRRDLLRQLAIGAGLFAAGLLVDLITY